jgi:hypothetical protein
MIKVRAGLVKIEKWSADALGLLPFARTPGLLLALGYGAKPPDGIVNQIESSGLLVSLIENNYPKLLPQLQQVIGPAEWRAEEHLLGADRTNRWDDGVLKDFVDAVEREFHSKDSLVLREHVLCAAVLHGHNRTLLDKMGVNRGALGHGLRVGAAYGTVRKGHDRLVLVNVVSTSDADEFTSLSDTICPSGLIAGRRDGTIELLDVPSLKSQWREPVGRGVPIRGLTSVLEYGGEEFAVASGNSAYLYDVQRRQRSQETEFEADVVSIDLLTDGIAALRLRNERLALADLKASRHIASRRIKPRAPERQRRGFGHHIVRFARLGTGDELRVLANSGTRLCVYSYPGLRRVGSYSVPTTFDGPVQLMASSSIDFIAAFEAAGEAVITGADDGRFFFHSTAYGRIRPAPPELAIYDRVNRLGPRAGTSQILIRDDEALLCTQMDMSIVSIAESTTSKTSKMKIAERVSSLSFDYGADAAAVSSGFRNLALLDKWTRTLRLLRRAPTTHLVPDFSAANEGFRRW